jgi:hypothetical protein
LLEQQPEQRDQRDPAAVATAKRHYRFLYSRDNQDRTGGLGLSRVFSIIQQNVLILINDVRCRYASVPARERALCAV